jgi:hypothetical protein
MNNSHAAMDRALRIQQAGAFGLGLFLLLFGGVAGLLWRDTPVFFTGLTASFAFSAVAVVTACTRAALTALEARVAKLEQRLAGHPAAT